MTGTNLISAMDCPVGRCNVVVSTTIDTVAGAASVVLPPGWVKNPAASSVGWQDGRLRVTRRGDGVHTSEGRCPTRAGALPTQARFVVMNHAPGSVPR
jgi:hypothetical protein